MVQRFTESLKSLLNIFLDIANIVIIFKNRHNINCCCDASLMPNNNLNVLLHVLKIQNKFGIPARNETHGEKWMCENSEPDPIIQTHTWFCAFLWFFRSALVLSSNLCRVCFFSFRSFLPGLPSF